MVRRVYLWEPHVVLGRLVLLLVGLERPGPVADAAVRPDVLEDVVSIGVQLNAGCEVDKSAGATKRKRGKNQNKRGSEWRFGELSSTVHLD